MQFPKRYLPSTRALLAFEAVARLGSFSLAADELKLSQGAISKQVKLLEQQLGVALLLREHQNTRLTAAGQSYAPQVRESLAQIAHASLAVSTNPHGGTLRLAILPTFGTRWLAPRLPQFLASSSGITINLVTKLKPFDFRLERLDAAIHVGDGKWPGTQSMFLMHETVVPACAPALLETHQFKNASQLHRAGLLHLATRPHAWSRWMQAQQGDTAPTDGMVFDQFATVAQAAIAGLGVALLPPFLIQRELDEGTLVPALPLPLQSEESYYLVWPEVRDQFPPLIAFRQWLAQAVETFSLQKIPSKSK